MIAKFSGACAHCGEQILKGSEMHYANKKAYHPVCANTGPEGPDSRDPHHLAAQLGYEPHSEILGGPLRILSSDFSDHDIAGCGASTSRRHEVRNVRLGPEGESEDCED